MKQGEMNWSQAIEFMTPYMDEVGEDLHCQVIWQRLQNGDRTQDLLMQITALRDLKNINVGKSPEWTHSIKWLNVARAKGKNLQLDLLWAQLETGDRTDELLALIQQAEENFVEPSDEGETKAKATRRR